MRNHHALVIESGEEEGIETALAWTKRELGMEALGNPDITILRYGLFAVEDARKVADLSASAPFSGDYKVIIISAGRAYHEAQNALLKIFEEPPRGVYIFLVLPSLGGLLPTLRSRVQVLKYQIPGTKSQTSAKYESCVCAWKRWILRAKLRK